MRESVCCPFHRTPTSCGLSLRIPTFTLSSFFPTRPSTGHWRLFSPWADSCCTKAPVVGGLGPATAQHGRQRKRAFVPFAGAQAGRLGRCGCHGFAGGEHRSPADEHERSRRKLSPASIHPHATALRSALALCSLTRGPRCPNTPCDIATAYFFCSWWPRDHSHKGERSQQTPSHAKRFARLQVCVFHSLKTNEEASAFNR